MGTDWQKFFTACRPKAKKLVSSTVSGRF